MNSANLIRVFDFYLTVMFLLSFARRYTVYWDALRLLFVLQGRWPKLVERLKLHHGVLVTAEVLRPLLIAFALTVIQMICSRVIWPSASLPVAELVKHQAFLTIVLLAAIPMVSVDVYFLVRVGRFDRDETEKYMDQAEHWLKSWHAPMIRIVTLGRINPRRMVDEEVRKSLDQLGQTVSWAARWVAIQVGCRVGFGIVIWLTSWLLTESLD